jgi:hypothetical protein
MTMRTMHALDRARAGRTRVDGIEAAGNLFSTTEAQ